MENTTYDITVFDNEEKAFKKLLKENGIEHINEAYNTEMLTTYTIFVQTESQYKALINATNIVFIMQETYTPKRKK
jgi:siroheme synthase (precorrin-2 oxidase/ferrochelatase)